MSSERRQAGGILIARFRTGGGGGSGRGTGIGSGGSVMGGGCDGSGGGAGGAPGGGTGCGPCAYIVSSLAVVLSPVKRPAPKGGLPVASALWHA